MAVHMMDKLEKIIHLAWEENPLGVQKLRVGAVAGQCTTDIPIKPINRYRPINWIGKSQKSQYRIGIGSADYKGLYRLIGFTYYSYFCRHEKSQNWVKLVQSLE